MEDSMYPSYGPSDGPSDGPRNGPRNEGSVSRDSQREEDAEDSNGTLVPKSFFSHDVEPGSKCEVEIVHVYDDEIEIKYTKPGKEEKPKSTTSTMDQADGAIDKMASMSEATAGE